jgi:hypothetical protein
MGDITTMFLKKIVSLACANGLNEQLLGKDINTILLHLRSRIYE